MELARIELADPMPAPRFVAKRMRDGKVLYMSYQTVEVVLENGFVRPFGGEKLPLQARALLTVLSNPEADGSSRSKELAEWWATRDRLPADEANAFADDIEEARRNLPPVKSAWD